MTDPLLDRVALGLVLHVVAVLGLLGALLLVDRLTVVILNFPETEQK